MLRSDTCMLGVIQIHGERLSQADIRDIGSNLLNDDLKILSMRRCHLEDGQFWAIMRDVGKCSSLLQLNLNLGVIANQHRVHMLSNSLNTNRSLRALFLHGSNLCADGMVVLGRALSGHPHITSLDLGDCKLTNSCIAILAQLLPNNGAKPGLRDLTLSGNTNITLEGWVRFFVAMAAGCRLRNLYLDYNNIGDEGLASLIVAMAAVRSLRVVDLEATGITTRGLKLLLHLVVTYKTGLKRIILEENQIPPVEIEAFKYALKSGVGDIHRNTEPIGGQETESDASDTEENENRREASAERSHGNVASGDTTEKQSHNPKTQDGTSDNVTPITNPPLGPHSEALKQRLINQLQNREGHGQGHDSNDDKRNDSQRSSSAGSVEIRHLVDDIVGDVDSIVTLGGSEEFLRPDTPPDIVQNLPVARETDLVATGEIGARDIASDSMSIPSVPSTNSPGPPAPKMGPGSPSFRSTLLDQVRVRSSLYPEVRQHDWHSLPLDVAKSWPINPSVSTVGKKSPVIVTDQGQIIS